MRRAVMFGAVFMVLGVPLANASGVQLGNGNEKPETRQNATAPVGQGVMNSTRRAASL